MIKSMHLRAGYAAALAAGVLLAGCSSEPDYPKTTAGAQNTASTSAPADPNVPAPEGSAPEANADGSFPDVNSVPTTRPTTTIQDLNQAPEGLSAAQSGTQYGEELIGGPTSSAVPPPAPEPDPAEDLPPIPEPGITTQSNDGSGATTQTSDSTDAAETSTYAAPMAEAAPEPEPEPEPVAEPEPAPQAATPPASSPQASSPQASSPQASSPQASSPQASSVQSAPLAPMQGAQPVTPVGMPQQGSQPFQPEAQLALAPGSVQTQAAALPQAQPAYGPNYAALAPENYGIGFPQPVLPPYQGYGNAQAMYRSPYASPPTNYGGAVVSASQPQVLQPPSNYPTYGATYGQPSYGAYGSGQPVGMIYFRDGSAKLSSDDRKVLKQIADMHKTYGGVVRVVGHASMRTGSMDYVSHQNANQRISEARAKAVARQLQRYGVPQAAIQTSAVSDSQPIYSEAMPNGEAANRRAEVYLTAY